MSDFSARSSMRLSRNTSSAFLFASLLLVSAILFVPISRASAAPSVVTLTSPNAQSGGGFGTSVAASGNIVVVGAPSEAAEGYPGAGNAYIFNATTSALLRTLTSPNAQADGNFGNSVAASGTVVVVGAEGEIAEGYSGAGNVYIFNATTGALLRTLTTPSDLASNQGLPSGNFGNSVAVNGNLVVVGANGEWANENREGGNAYIFNAATGALLSTLTSPNAQDHGDFGVSVAVSGNFAVVGADGEIVNGYSVTGSAYIFDATTGGAPVSTPTPSSNAQGGGGFGEAVAASGNIVVVGAYAEALNGLSVAGVAYIYNAATQGALVSTIGSPNEQTRGGFGFSVAASGNVVVVGAYGEAADGNRQAGNAYIFNATTGFPISTLTSPNAQADGAFGFSVAESGSVVVVGAPSEAADGHSLAGNVYTYAVTASTTPVPEFPVQSLIAILTVTVALVAVLIPKNQKTSRYSPPERLT